MDQLFMQFTERGFLGFFFGENWHVKSKIYMAVKWVKTTNLILKIKVGCLIQLAVKTYHITNSYSDKMLIIDN